MKPRESVTSLLTTVKYRNGSEISFLSEAGGSSLSNISSVQNGDFKTPNGQNYLKLHYRHFSGEKVEYDGLPGYRARYTGIMPVWRVFNPFGGWLVPETDHALRIAKDRFFNKLRDSNLNLATSLAEGRQTKAMFRDLIDKLIALARSAKRRALRSIYRGRDRNAADAIGNAWLQYKYGWEQILRDIFNLCEFERNKAKLFRVKGSVKGAFDVNRTTPISTSHPVIVGTCQQAFIGLVVCDCAVDNKYLADLNRLSSFNPAALTWELLPLSFVADWLIGIAKWLEQLEIAAGAGLRFVRGFTTVVGRDTYTSIIPSQTFGNSLKTVIPNAMTGRAVRTVKSRVRLTSFPSVEPPRLELKYGLEKFFTSAALLNQILVPKVRQKFGWRAR